MITHETAWAFKPEIRRAFLKNHPFPPPEIPPIPEHRLSAALAYKPSKPPHKSRDRSGFIYFIKLNEFTKIGMATNPQQRLLELSVSSPYPLTLLRSVQTPTMRSSENALHNHFSKYHYAREWFLIPNEMLKDFLSWPDHCIANLNCG